MKPYKKCLRCRRAKEENWSRICTDCFDAMAHVMPGVSLKDPYFVYFLFQEKEIVYVGMTKNPVGRLGSHWVSKEKAFTAFVLVESRLTDAEIRQTELNHIRTFRPKFNQSGNPDWIEARHLAS